MSNISIHAPCTGSDVHRRIRGDVAEISIHAPCTGSDGQLPLNVFPLHISIHAPCTGSDLLSSAQWKMHGDFNPRSLHGERHEA